MEMFGSDGGVNDKCRPWYICCSCCAIIWQIVVAIVIMVDKLDQELIVPIDATKLKQNTMPLNILESWRSDFIQDVLVLDAGCITDSIL